MKDKLIYIYNEKGGKKPISKVEENSYLVLFHYGIFNAFYASNEEESFDLFKYYSKVSIAAYCSLKFYNFEERARFIKSFYETYRLLDNNTIFNLIFIEDSPMYDDSREALLGRVLAMGENLQSGFIDEVLDSIISRIEN